MRLPFNADRLLTHVAANLATVGETGAGKPDDVPSFWPTDDGPASHRAGRSIERGARDWQRLEAAARVAVVGEPEELAAALTRDSTGWSPNGTYKSRRAAISLATQAHAWLYVDAFDLITLWWARPNVFVEWELAARQTEPLLIGDDILVEPSGCQIHLAGAAAAPDRSRPNRKRPCLLGRRRVDRTGSAVFLSGGTHQDLRQQRSTTSAS